MKEVKKLIDLGKEKGYLTYDDVNDMLPAEVVSPDQIDDVMSIFGEMDIEVVDANQRVSLGGAGEELVEDEEEEKEVESDIDGDMMGKTGDPVRMYLREMGTVSLLSREGEVEIAKKIEHGEKQVIEEVLSSPEVRPTDPPPTPPIVGMPIVNVVADHYDAISVGSIPAPAMPGPSLRHAG